jgi:pyruvate,water dikinase
VNEGIELTPEVVYGMQSVIREQVENGVAVRMALLHLLCLTKPDIFYGLASAPGVAEGMARVVLTVDELAELKPGEILVAPTTDAAWRPLFGTIKAVVTDAGGALSHAVIVAREYGLPCVVGCGEATKKIHTGQRIRIDGDNRCVYILGRK